MIKFLHHHYHTRYHLKYKHAKKLFAIDLFLLALAVALLGTTIFLFFWQPGIMNKIDLSIKLNADRAKSGDHVCFNVNYYNRNTLKLENPVLGLNLPVGFVIDPQKTHKNYSNQSVIKLSTIEPGGKENISICGILWLEPNSELTVTASLTYNPEGAKYKEQKNASLLLKLPGSNLQAELITPKQTLISASIPINYSLKNTSEKTIENIFLNNNLEIEIADIKNGFSLEPGETKKFSLQTTANTTWQNLGIEFTSQVLVNNTYIKQTIDNNSLSIIQPKISIGANYNADDKFVDASQTLPLQITWHNNNAYTLQNMEVELTTEPNIIDLEATAKMNGIKIKNGKLVIDGEKRTALSSAVANTGDNFTIDLKIKESLSLQKSENPYLVITPTLIVKLNNIDTQNYIQKGAETKLPIATEMSWNVESRYYTPEGDQLGRGELPPKVGETTKYWILIKIWNTTSAVKDVKFSATLPTGIQFTKRQSVTIGPSILLDEFTNQINWAYSKLPPNSQTGLYFEVAITPNKNQAGDSLELLKNAKVEAVDEFTGKKITLTKTIITNLLPADDRGSKLGNEVVE